MSDRKPACHRCMAATVDGAATSRLDSKTPLCTECERAEAIEDFVGEILPKEEWVYTKMARDYGLEETEVEQTDVDLNSLTTEQLRQYAVGEYFFHTTGTDKPKEQQ